MEGQIQWTEGSAKVFFQCCLARIPWSAICQGMLLCPVLCVMYWSFQLSCPERNCCHYDKCSSNNCVAAACLFTKIPLASVLSHWLARVFRWRVSQGLQFPSISHRHAGGNSCLCDHHNLKMRVMIVVADLSHYHRDSLLVGHKRT